MRLGIRVLALDNIYEAAGAATAELSAEVAARRRRLCDGMTTCACTYACDPTICNFLPSIITPCFACNSPFSSNAPQREGGCCRKTSELS